MGNLLQKAVLAGTKIIKARITHKKIPLYVSFQLTKYCNLRCKYCYSELENLKDVKEMTTEEILRMIDVLAKEGTVFLRILGGEPTLRKDIGKIIDYCKKKNIITEISTNGVLVKDKIKELKNLDFMSVSIDGDRDVNDAIRGKGSYDKAIEGIEIAKKHKIHVRLHAVLSKKNLHRWKHMYELAKKYKVIFNFSTIALSNDLVKNKNIKELAASPEEIHKFFTNLQKERNKGFPIFNSDIFFDHTLKWPLPGEMYINKKDVNKVDTSNVVKCLAGQNHCWIDCDGGVYACPTLWKKGLNLNEVGFKKAWNYLEDQIPCYSCQANGDMELYSVFLLSPKAIINISKNFVRKLTPKFK